MSEALFGVAKKTENIIIIIIIIIIGRKKIQSENFKVDQGKIKFKRICN